MGTENFDHELNDLCRALKLPSVARDALRLSAQAVRQGQEPIDYLRDLLLTEVEERRERRAARRVKEAGFPLVKTLSSFDFELNPSLSPSKIRALCQGSYIAAAEPVIFIGEPGTGKTHLATAFGYEAAQQGLRVRYTTAAALATRLVEARDARELGSVVRRFAKVDVLILDEWGYLPLARSDAELLFQVLGERQEQRPIVVTTNLPFSEWTSMFPDPRLCRALVDRMTHKAHIIETGKRSIRLEQSLKRKTKGQRSMVSQGEAERKEESTTKERR